MRSRKDVRGAGGPGLGGRRLVRLSHRIRSRLASSTSAAQVVERCDQCVRRCAYVLCEPGFSKLRRLREEEKTHCRSAPVRTMSQTASFQACSSRTPIACRFSRVSTAWKRIRNASSMRWDRAHCERRVSPARQHRGGRRTFAARRERTACRTFHWFIVGSKASRAMDSRSSDSVDDPARATLADPKARGSGLAHQLPTKGSQPSYVMPTPTFDRSRTSHVLSPWRPRSLAGTGRGFASSRDSQRVVEWDDPVRRVSRDRRENGSTRAHERSRPLDLPEDVGGCGSSVGDRESRRDGAFFCRRSSEV